MDSNNFFNLNNAGSDFFLKLLQDYQKILNENKILKNSLKNSTKNKKENIKPSPKFYLTPKTSKLIVKCINHLKETDPISGWFVYLLLISGCRGTEMQKVKMQDISTFLSKTGKTLYTIKVNVAKKEMPLVLEKLSSTQKSSRLSKQHIKIISKKKLLTQGVLIFSKRANISLKITKLILSIFLKNSKIFLKSRGFV